MTDFRIDSLKIIKKTTKPYIGFLRMWVGECCNLVFFNIPFSGHVIGDKACIKAVENAFDGHFYAFRLLLVFISDIRTKLNKLYLQIFTKPYITYSANFYICTHVLGSWGAALHENMIYFTSTMRVYCLGVMDLFRYIPFQQNSRFEWASRFKNYTTIPVYA